MPGQVAVHILVAMDATHGTDGRQIKWFTFLKGLYIIVIPKKLQIYLVFCYHMYILYPIIDLTEKIIIRHVYRHGIRDTVQK